MKLKLFLRKNAVYLIVAFCVLAIGLSITLIVLNSGEKEDTKIKVEQISDIPATNNDIEEVVSEVVEKKKDKEVVSEPVVAEVVFDLPVANFTRVCEYSNTLSYNSTLKRFQAHQATDFFAEEGTNVLAVYDGTVESVTNDLLKGYTIIIDHGNGLKSVYNSLLDGDSVVAGQKVKKGDVIGEVSTSNRQEYKEGAHLHFELLEDGISIDPENYLLIEDK